MPEVTIETHLVVHLDSQEIAQEYLACLEPELNKMPAGRSSITYIAPQDGTLEFTISSRDFTAARAAFNSIIQYLRVIDDTWKVTEQPGK
ncbi:MAG TPA: KEOPS complex subunit Pcc1 [Candidatus Lokiarchaeia archaeon]|nr:KEOPS complex subunit Pcc1 [Candidatus Lokiarchaeia archaeon]